MTISNLNFNNYSNLVWSKPENKEVITNETQIQNSVSKQTQDITTNVLDQIESSQNSGRIINFLV